ncbi:MAG: Na+/H+ antiporter subunit E [Actinomycetota bacterium]
MTRLSGAVIWLTVLWTLLWGNFSWANVLGGIAVSIAVVTLARLPRATRRADDSVTRVNPLKTLRFIAYAFWSLLQSNWVLAKEIITFRDDESINAGVVAVPLRTDSDTIMMVVANLITLTPGTLTIEVSGTPPVVYVNVLHLHEIEEVRAELLRIEELAVHAFGSRSARAQFEEAVA